MFDNQYSYINANPLYITKKILITSTLPVRWKVCNFTIKTVKLIGTKKKTKFYTVRTVTRVYNNYILCEKLDERFKLIKLTPIDTAMDSDPILKNWHSKRNEI
jgi:hypothetical protein